MFIICYLFVISVAVGQNTNKLTAFNSTEINFWIKQLNTNFKEVKFEKQANKDAIFSLSKRVPNGFESSNFIIFGKDFDYNMVTATKLHKTKAEALLFLKNKHKQLELHLKNQKFNIEEIEGDYVYTKPYGTKGGQFRFYLYVDEQLEVVNDRITDKITDYAVKLEMKLSKNGSYDAVEQEPQTKPNPKNSVKFDCTDVTFWENELKNGLNTTYFAENKDTSNNKQTPDTFDSSSVEYSIYTGRAKVYGYKTFISYQEASVFFNNTNKVLKACLTTKKYKDAKMQISPKDKEWSWNSYDKTFDTKKGAYLEFFLQIKKRSSEEQGKATLGYFVIFTATKDYDN